MRLQGVKKENAGPFVRILFRLLRWRTGKVPKPLTVYAHRPAILRSFLKLGRTVQGSDQLPARLRRLVMYWTARLVECPF